MDFSIPQTSAGDLDKCHRYVPYNRTNSDKCFAENFNKNSQENCGTDFIFRDNELTISNDVRKRTKSIDLDNVIHIRMISY